MPYKKPGLSRRNSALRFARRVKKLSKKSLQRVEAVLFLPAAHITWTRKSTTEFRK